MNASEFKKFLRALPQPANLDEAMSFVLNHLVGCSALWLENDGQDLSLRSEVERTVQTLCLPFLRIAALLRHHLFAEEIPNIR